MKHKLIRLNRVLNWVIALAVVVLITYQQHLLFRSWDNAKSDEATLVRLQIENAALRQTVKWQENASYVSPW